MYKFSSASVSKLNTCEKDLQVLFNEVVKHIDTIIIQGHRGEKEQNEAYNKGFSKLKYPNGKHNSNPSRAVDAAPYNTKAMPVNWTDSKKFFHFAGLVEGIASQLLKAGKINSTVRWGGDWDSDNNFNDNTFNDLVHFELVPIKK